MKDIFMNEYKILDMLKSIKERYEYFPIEKDDNIKLIGCKDIRNTKSYYLSYCSESFLNSQLIIVVENLLKNIDKKSVVISDSKLLMNYCNLVLVENPRYVFAKLIKIFKDNYKENTIKIGKNFKQGNNCCLKNCIIGNNVTIGDNVIIGGPGFGYVRDTHTDEIINFDHYGKVIIKDNVTIHSLVAIDRGTLNDTIIEKNCKIDNLCHIAHNVKIGKNTMISARSLVGGGTEIGENCWIGAGSTIIDRIIIRDNIFIGSGTNVIKSITGYNETWVGNPARRIK